jgi:hypothetical protein
MRTQSAGLKVNLGDAHAQIQHAEPLKPIQNCTDVNGTETKIISSFILTVLYVEQCHQENI